MSATAWLSRADRSLASARAILAIDPDGASSRAYYAMFYAARAALVQLGRTDQAESKTHGGVIGAFGQYLAKPGLIAREHGRAFAQVAELRLAADYEVAELAGVTAAEILYRAEAFVTAVRAWLAAQTE